MDSYPIGPLDHPPEALSADLMIEGGIVLTMVEGQQPIENGKIIVRNGEIAGILEKEHDRTIPNGQTEVIDATEGIIMPGLVNGHTHAAMTLFRGLADDLPLKTWLFDRIFPAEAKFLSPMTVRWSSLLGCLEMIASGTTCFLDGYFFQDETVQAAHQAGLRGLISQGVIDLPAPGVENPSERFQVAKAFVEKWTGFSELILPGIFCHSLLTCSEKTLQKAWELSCSFKFPLQIHLSETRDEVTEIIRRTGKRPVQYLDQLGLINEGLIAAHAVHLDREEILCLKKKGAKVVHVPESNMKLCSGVARVTEMANLGIPLGLGTDGCASNNNLDIFEEMDAAAKLSKVFSLDPVGLNARTVLTMATRWGSAIPGLEKKIGTLEVGKKADIIVLDLKSPHMNPLYDPYSTLVYAASGSDVRDVMVNGRLLMRDREFLTLDADEIMREVKRIAERVRP